MTRTLRLALVLLLAAAAPLAAQERGPLRIEITEGVIEPLPIAVPTFTAQTAGTEALAEDVSRVVAADLVGTGLFRQIPPEAFISRPDFDGAVQYADWKAINAQALVTGAVSLQGDRLTVQFRLYDVFSEAPLGEGLQFGGDPASWRRIAHKVADQVYSRITGEGGYFDSRVVFVDETGPKDARVKRLAVMDYDGANLQYLTGGEDLVLGPRFSPDGTRVLFTSFAGGQPRIHELDLATLRSRPLDAQPDTTYAPRFAPDGQRIVYSRVEGGNSDIYVQDLRSGARTSLTDAPSIETSPSFSPDGSQIVFESDRSGTQQLYVMSAGGGGEPRRISFGAGRYGSPVWSPRGDLIAFTKQNAGRFHIGVMRTDGSEERLLTASFLDEGPTWAPNGRVLMFTREQSGAGGQPAVYSVDISGRNLRRVETGGAASDPSWSPLLP